MPASCALAWPAFFPACLGPSPARGYSTLQAGSAFFPPQGNWSSTKVGTSFPSFPLPAVWYLDSSCVGQRLGQNKPDSSSLPAHLFPGWTICCLLLGVGTGVWEVSPSTQGWPDPSPLQPVAAPPPQVESTYDGEQEGLWMPVPHPTYCIESPLPLHIHHPVVRHSTLGLVPVALRSPPHLFPTVYPSLQYQSREKYWSPWIGAERRKQP